MDIFHLLLLLGYPVAAYIIRNQNKKNETYEQVISSFYQYAESLLTAARELDERKLFESDDEVGTLFSQLIDLIGTLRPIVMGIPDDLDDKLS